MDEMTNLTSKFFKKWGSRDRFKKKRKEKEEERGAEEEKNLIKLAVTWNQFLFYLVYKLVLSNALKRKILKQPCWV